jgi:hypothetical protein
MGQICGQAARFASIFPSWLDGFGWRFVRQQGDGAVARIVWPRAALERGAAFTS